jgi:hypothetical protein
MQSTYSNNYGLNNSYDYYEYVFDSSQAERAYVNGTLKTNWPMFSIGGKQPLTNIAAVKVLEVQIPFSYFATITPASTSPPTVGGGIFTYTEVSPDPGTVTLNIVAGNYTVAQLQAALKQQLDLAHVTNGGAANAFTVSYDPISSKFFVTGFDGGGINYTLTFPSTFSTQALGVEPNASYSSDIAGYVSFPYVANLTGPPYLYVNSQSIGTLVNLFLPQNIGTSGNAGPQMAKIPVNSNPGGTIYWQDPDPQKWFDLQNLSSLQQLDFYLTLGTNSSPIDFRGLPFSIKLGILLANTNQSDLGSGLEESRIVKRIRPI